MHLPSRIESGGHRILDSFRKQRHSLRRPEEVYLAAAITLEAHERDYPLSIADAANHYGVDRHEVGRAKRTIMKVMDRTTLPPDPSRFVERFADDLSLPERVVDDAKTTASEHDHLDHRPAILAAASLYHTTLGTNEELTQQRLAALSNSNTTSIGTAYRNINDTQ